jgi:hypothetical protein
LGGDCCHNRLCYNPGERLVSELNHWKIDIARQTVEWIKEIRHLRVRTREREGEGEEKEEGGVIVMLAHEKERVEECKDEGVWPKGPWVNEWVVRALATKNAK